jgi:hypothetical protein
VRLYLYSFRGVKIVDREREVLKQVVECTEVTEKPLVDPMSSEAKTYIWRDIGKEFLAGVSLKPGPAWIVLHGAMALVGRRCLIMVWRVDMYVFDH